MPSYQCFLFAFICLSLHAASSANLIKPSCPHKCGNLTISYPFGIGAGCSLDPSFTIFCDDTIEPPKPYLRLGKIAVQFNQSGAPEIISISKNQVLIKSPTISSLCHNQLGNDTITYVDIDFSASSFTLSATDNKLTLIGCDDRISTFLTPSGGECTSTCASINDIKEGCTASAGRGCCQTSIPAGIQKMSARPSSSDDHIKVFSFNLCSYVFLGDPSNFSFKGASDLSDPTFVNRIVENVPIVLDWQISNQSCSEVQKTTQYPCKENSHCLDSDTGRGYRCICNNGYSGNPYLNPGCQASGFAALAILLGSTLLYMTMNKRKILRLREKFFEQNGGLLLKQRLSTSTEDTVVSTKVFTVNELERATNNFSQKCILGQGGSGTVYKGILLDKCVVAIKKSKFMEKTQIEEFINEVIILTQINHRNVVKLLGCCLETEVPLLVYEYIAEGTLQHHIDQHKEMAWFSWDNRLRIAIEAAGALSYLHSAASVQLWGGSCRASNREETSSSNRR